MALNQVTKFEKYDRLRDSGLEWLGKIPEHWDVVKLKRLFQIVNGSTPSSTVEEYWNGNILWATPNDLGKTNDMYIGDTERKITELGYSSCGTSLVPPGSLVLSTRAPIGHLAIAGRDICTNQGCKSLKVREEELVVSEYYYYMLLSAKSVLQSLGQGSTFTELSNDNLGALGIPYFASEEQDCIAAVLSKRTSKLDKLINKKQKLIDLLQEKRQALITQAVTKGLDPSVPMKDSGVGWLGDIPRHWEVSKLKYLSKMIVPMRDKPPHFDGNIPWIRIEDFIGKYVSKSKSERGVSQEMVEKMNLKIFPAGTVLCSCSCTMGATAIVRKPLISNQTFIGINPNDKRNSDFIYYYMNAMQDILQAQSTGAIQRYLSRQEFENFLITGPPIEEKEKITQYLDEHTSRIDEIIAQLMHQLKLIEEYRRTLITNAVTGKIDVRGEFE